jgi:chromosome segregation ATPase
MAPEEQEAIKSAVSQGTDEEMQPSMAAPAPGGVQEQQDYQQYGYQDPNQVQSYQDQAYNGQQYSSYSPSTDTITEISEQVVSEKLSRIKGDIEKLLDLKSTIDTKIDFLDQRLKRIEATIDKLQLAILQKVGEYVNNVQDLKTNLDETQKSFKSLLDKKQPVKKPE